MLLWILLLGVGPGTEVEADIGYWTRPAGQPGRKFVSIPAKLVLVGVETAEEARFCGRDRPLLVFDIREPKASGLKHWYLSRAEVVFGKVTRLKFSPLPGLEGNDLNVPFRYEPPR